MRIIVAIAVALISSQAVHAQRPSDSRPTSSSSSGSSSSSSGSGSSSGSSSSSSGSSSSESSSSSSGSSWGSSWGSSSSGSDSRPSDSRPSGGSSSSGSSSSGSDSSSSGGGWYGGGYSGGGGYTGGGYSGGDYYGGAVRRGSNPTGNPDRSVSPAPGGDGVFDGVPGGSFSAAPRPSTPPKDVASEVEHAVRRDSLPDNLGLRRVIGGHRGHDDENERGREYWHERGGYRYCHRVDSDGSHWYYWYDGRGYYTTRYHNGRHWGYDPYDPYGRHHCYWNDDYCLYQGGYAYDGYYRRYETSSGGGAVLRDFDETKVPVSNFSQNVTVSFGAMKRTADQMDGIGKNYGFFDFDQSKLGGGSSIGIEVNQGLGPNFELGVGFVAGSYQNNADSVYADYTRPNGAEVRQQFQLSNAPVTVLGRYYPTGRTAQVQPYVGGGLVMNNWKYRETGDFINFQQNNAINFADYNKQGRSTGGIALAGIRAPLGDGRFMLGGEVQYAFASKANVPEDNYYVNLGGPSARVGLTVNLGKKKKTLPKN